MSRGSGQGRLRYDARMQLYQHHRPGYLQDLDGPMEALASTADAPAETRGQPGRLRASTWFVIALTVLCLAMIPAGDALAGLGIVFGIIFFIIALAMFSNDMRIPGARGRTRPEDALKCYFRAVQGRRWKVAMACLSPMARERKVQVPLIPELQTSPVMLMRISPEQLKEYWRTIAHAGNSLTRWIKRIDTIPISTEGNIHVYRVTLSIEYYPTLILLGILGGLLPLLILWLALRKTYVLTCNVVVYKHKSQWWLLSGELPPALPRAYVHANTR
jgi:hypothetical protein